MLRDKDEMLRELESDGDELFSSGRLNNLADVTLTVAGVLGSLVATILVGAQLHRTWIAAAAAAVPAATSTLQRTLDLRGRSAWYFHYAARLRGLWTELKYAQSVNVEDFAKKRAAFEVDMEERWLVPGMKSHSR